MTSGGETIDNTTNNLIFEVQGANGLVNGQYLNQKPIIVKNLMEEKRFSGPSFLLEHQVVSGMSCLINHTNPPYGVLGVHTKTYRDFTESDVNFIVSIANILRIELHDENGKKKTKQDLYQSVFAMVNNFFEI